jgi:hypothetical protein
MWSNKWDEGPKAKPKHPIKSEQKNLLVHLEAKPTGSSEQAGSSSSAALKRATDTESIDDESISDLSKNSERRVGAKRGRKPKDYQVYRKESKLRIREFKALAKNMTKSVEERKKWRSCASALKTRLAIRTREEEQRAMKLVAPKPSHLSGLTIMSQNH